ncbi:MAG: hypothetical protein HXY30_03965 [Pseudorhodoplanes sp.]|nr:hypothetical protein [Pseudorhodoplanes sp.]
MVLVATEPVSARPLAKATANGAFEFSSQNTQTTRKRTRVIVRERSFLDAGTEVLPGERKFNDYAFPPNYSPLDEALGPGQNFWRQPLLNPWDVPGRY